MRRGLGSPAAGSLSFPSNSSNNPNSGRNPVKPKMRLQRLICMAMVAAMLGMVMLLMQMASLQNVPSPSHIASQAKTAVTQDIQGVVRGTLPRGLSSENSNNNNNEGGVGTGNPNFRGYTQGAAKGAHLPAGAGQDHGHLDPDWPAPPVYDNSRRAVESTDRAGGWQAAAQRVIDANAALLQQSPARPSTVTLVSSIYDIGRGSMGTSEQWSVLRRPFSFYRSGLKNFLAYKFPKVLYLDEEAYHAVKDMIDAASQASAGAGPVKVIIKSKDDIRSEFKQYDLVQNIRSRREWLQQAAWLANSPQALLDLFNPIVMSKLSWTRDAARWNPFNTDGFLWLDVAHLCHDPSNIGLNKQDNIARYLDRLLVTFYDYEPVTSEVRGFTRSAFNTYLGRNANDQSPLPMARGGVLGGTREYLEVAAAVFNVIVAETLEAGLMGTEENILSILDHSFPDLVHHFDNGDKGNCAVFKEFISPPIDPAIDGYDTRGLTCKYVEAERAVRCFDGLQRCPDYVDPMFLEEAKGQGVCSEERASYYCRVVCSRDGNVAWQGSPCPNDGVSPCPPWPRSFFKDYHPNNPAPSATLAGPHPEPAAPHPPTDDFAQFTGEALLGKAEPAEAQRVRNQGGFDLRGIACEVLDGQERCFYEDTEGREKCPEHVTSVLLSGGAGQYLCLPETAGYYCTVSCSQGTNINWHAHEIKWCDENADRCPPRPEIIPIDQYKLEPWSEVVRPPMQCTRPAGGMPKITAVILAYKETESLAASLETYDKAGFLQNMDETILYLNARNREMEELAEKYTKPPYNVKLMGDSNNYGIAQALNWMFGNASNEHVLLLEKDFRLVESGDCAMEQLQTGLDLLESGEAHVVRFRSRHNPGRPNWARILYKDHEDDVFKNQPNLLCNFFHWVDSPDKRWPEQFWPCGPGKKSDGEVDRSKVFYCTKAFYCNWTNNPVLISKRWWHEQYEVHFDEFKNINPYDDLELYMNWEPNAWNDRPWIVAEGEGVFKHMDMKKYGM